MANKYYSISTTGYIANLKAALVDKYGAGVTVHYETTDYLIFSCAAIANKVIKVYRYSTVTFTWTYGDSWTSTTTIVNPIVFAGQAYNGADSAAHLVLGDNFLLFNALNSLCYSSVAIVAKMTNDKFICYGGVGTTSSQYNSNIKGRNTSDNTDIKILNFERIFCSAAGKLYKQPVLITNLDGALMETSEGTPATITGLYNISHATSSSTVLKTDTSLFTSVNLCMADAITHIKTSLFAEF